MTMIYCAAPDYVEHSNGVRILYGLVEYLNQCGLEARILTYDENLVARDKEGKHPLRKLVEESDIVIYPDAVTGNPFGAKNVVRYLGNRPYHLNGCAVTYGKTDYVTAYSRAIDPNLPQLFLLKDERSLIEEYKNVKKQNAVCLYYGKIGERIVDQTSAAKGFLPNFDQVHIITRFTPRPRQKVLELLARSSLLISFDPLSNLSYEATLLGTPAVVMDNAYNIEKDHFNIPLWGVGFSLSDYTSLREEVQYAYQGYEKHLSHQKELVAEWATNAIAHFDRVNEGSDTEYIHNCSALLEQQMRDDRVRYEQFNGGTPLVNIGTISDLPKDVLHLLSLPRYVIMKSVLRPISRDQYVNVRRRVIAVFRSLRLYPLVRFLWRNGRRIIFATVGLDRGRKVLTIKAPPQHK